MTTEQETKNRRVETDIMGVPDVGQYKYCEPRDFCNDWNLVYLMETRLDEMLLLRAYMEYLERAHPIPLVAFWHVRHPKSPEFCVDAALAAFDASQAGETSHG